MKWYDCLVYSHIHFAFLVCLKFIVFIKTHKERDIELEMPISVEHAKFGYFIDKAPKALTGERSLYGRGRINQLYISCPELIPR